MKRLLWCSQWACRPGSIVLLISVLALAPVGLLAQVDTGNISGTVTDETGGALPGVTITVTGLSTGQTRTTVTNEVGRYLVPGLQPANYSVKAELQSFTTVMRSQVMVNVGSTIDINMTLRVATMQETVNVTSQAPLIESTRAELSNVISQEQLASLPSKSRQFLDFTLLLPATVDSVSITSQGAGFSLGGSRASEAALLVDGFYNMDEGFDLPKQRHSQEAIQEFQVISFGGQAEYGRAIGGVVNAVTKSGGNAFRGAGYGFYRNQAMNANDPGLALRGAPKPEFSRQQWGGTMGGPLVHDKSFFFAAYERLNQDQPQDNAISAANAAAIGLPASDIGNVSNFLRSHFAFAKVDHNISSNSHIQGSFSITRANSMLPRAFETISRGWELNYTDLAYLVKWTGIAGEGKILHEIKASYFPRFYGVTGPNQGGPPIAAAGQINVPQETNATPPAVTISSVASFGATTLNNKIDTHPVQALYSSTIFANKHSLKFGADYMNSFYDYTLYSQLHGAYSFSSLANYLRGTYSQYTQGFGDPHNPRRHQYLSGFFQDSWQANSRLTMNYGLRYDIEVHPESPTGQRLGWDRNEFGPRFALSYDLTGKGKTFLKFASGVYYDRIFQNITTFYTNIKGYQSLKSYTWTPTTPGAPVFPQVFATPPATLPGSALNSNILPDSFKTPASGQVIGTVEHAITPSLVVSASGVYTRHWNVDYTLDKNLAWTGTAWVRPDPNYRQLTQYQFNGYSNYVGGIFDVKRRGTKAGMNGSLTVQRARDVGNNYASLPVDQRIGVDGEYGPQADTPTVRGVVSGWYNITPTVQVSGSFQARTGMAVNPIASGLDLIGAGVLGSRTPTFGRNSFRARAFNSADMRFTWMLPFQGKKVSVYGEVFNLYNRVNVTTVDNNYGATPGQPLPNFLAPLTYYPPRQAQVGIHLAF